jgi:hypothetical protein
MQTLARNEENMQSVELYFQERYNLGMVAWFSSQEYNEGQKMSELKLIERCINNNDFDILLDVLEAGDDDIPVAEVFAPACIPPKPEPVQVVTVTTPKPEPASDPALMLMNAVKAMIEQKQPVQLDEKRVVELAEVAAKRVMASFLTQFLAALNK